MMENNRGKKGVNKGGKEVWSRSFDREVKRQ
jgi:hypothetical protein